MLPELSTEIPLGRLNWPGPEPGEPNVSRGEIFSALMFCGSIINIEKNNVAIHNAKNVIFIYFNSDHAFFV